MRNLMNFAVIIGALICLVNCSSKPESTSPQEIVIGIKADETIMVNDEVIFMENLVTALNKIGVDFKTHVNLQIEGDVEMGVVNAVQKALRSTPVMKIFYADMNN
jgi:biopolymer transport protein ExbD